MSFITGITLCCLLLYVQPQTNYSPNYNSDIHFPDVSHSAVPLSVPNPNDLDQNAIRSIYFPNNQPQKCSTGIHCGNVQQQNGIRQNTATLNQNLAQQQQQQQLGTQRPAQTRAQQIFLPEPQTQTSYDRQSTPQRSQEAQRIHENAFGRVQSQPNTATIQQYNRTQGPPNFSQSGQKLPQRQGGPSTSVSQNVLNKPAGFPTPVKPPPVSNLNYPTEAAPGFNNLLFSVTDFGMNMIKVNVLFELS